MVIIVLYSQQIGELAIMTDYKPPCFSGRCERLSAADDHTKQLCKSMGEVIAQAGGIGIFEVTPCPVDALFEIGSEETNLQVLDIRQKLGVTTVWSDPDILD